MRIRFAPPGYGMVHIKPGTSLEENHPSRFFPKFFLIYLTMATNGTSTY